MLVMASAEPRPLGAVAGRSERGQVSDSPLSGGDQQDRPVITAAPTPPSRDPGEGSGTGSELDLVLVHRRAPEVIAETAAAFLAQGVRLRIVVVDNGSTVDELDKLRRGLPEEVAVLPQGANRGFGPAANAGLRWFLAGPEPGADLGPESGPGVRDRGAPWLAVAPHDARPAPDCLRTLLAELSRHPRAGLASADVGDGLTPVVDRYFGAIPTPARVIRGWEPAGYPHGTLMVVRRTCVEQIGLFDERYFAYCEEADLALRARGAGWQVGVVRGAEVRNGGLGSHVAVVDYLQLRNTLLLVRDHFGRYAVTVRIVTAVCQLLAGLFSSQRRGPYWDAPARVRAVVDFLRRRFGPPPDRLWRS
jgi:N-acetylglucosaminyl-diphospho-decaprenol L-rhamnosyltransferase